MSRIAPAPMASAAKATSTAAPGSNGFWRREWYRLPGTYTWTAPKSGLVKIQALGTGAGAKRILAGPAGGFGEKTLFVAAGQTLTLVVGQGSLGSAQLENPVSQGGTTSISGAPVGGTPLIILGARNPSVSSNQVTNASEQVGGTATGPWDLSYPGGIATGVSNVGGPSSGSPFGPGFNGGVSGRGGSGWGGQSLGAASSTHYTASSGSVPGLLSRTAPLPFWDMRDVDSPGGSDSVALNVNSGPGAGGGGGPGNTDGGGGVSAFGGGTGHSSGFSANVTGATGGNGAGGGATNSNSSGTWTGGKGGDGMIFLFWDEVTL